MLAFVASDQGVLHFDCLAAKYAEANGMVRPSSSGLKRPILGVARPSPFTEGGERSWISEHSV
jgi:hypothetical protein